MLTEDDFAKLDDYPTAAHLETLPVWARLYEQQLRAVARWWSIRNVRHRPRFPALDKPRRGEMSFDERLQTLPLWAQDWFRTLAFEIVWQREQVAPMVHGATRSKLFMARREKKQKGPHSRPARQKA